MARQTRGSVGVPDPHTSGVISGQHQFDERPYTGGFTVLAAPGDTIVMTLTGVIDTRMVGRLRTELVAALLRPRPRQLILDLCEVVELDALSTGTIVAGCQVADDCNVRVVIRSVTDDVVGPLRRAGLPASVQTVAGDLMS